MLDLPNTVPHYTAYTLKPFPREAQQMVILLYGGPHLETCVANPGRFPQPSVQGYTAPECGLQDRLCNKSHQADQETHMRSLSVAPLYQCGATEILRGQPCYGEAWHGCFYE
jgi:hypothetical protein